ncbi:MAG: PQQ-dependent sugar dehydrogenase, partial [Bdellovibrionales bacterium]|nr:PQQ-dependent sugar dehydrogenase [Bdellovibrionales bacterium]
MLNQARLLRPLAGLAACTLALAASASGSPLAFPATGTWNGFNNHTVVLECLNGGVRNASVSLTMRAENGEELGTTTFSIPSLGARHLILNSFPITDRYGTYSLDLLTPQAAGHLGCVTSTYRPGLSGEVQYAYSQLLSSPLTGETSGIINSMNPDAGQTPVHNFLSVVNSDTSLLTFTLEQWEVDGTVNGVEQLTLQPNERTDIALGHTQQSANGQFLGSYRLTPDRGNAPYLAFLARYWAPNFPDYRFGFVLDAASGSCSTQSLYLSTMNPAKNWIEVLNSSDLATGVTVTIYDAAGSVRGTETLILAPHQQIHLFTNQYLGESAVGRATLSCSNSSAQLVAASLHYGSDAANLPTRWGYAGAVEETAAGSGSRLVAPANTFLGMANWLKVSTESTSAPLTELLLFSETGAQLSRTISATASPASVDFPMHQILPGDALGIGVLTPLDGDTVYAAALRVFSDAAGRISTILRTPLVEVGTATIAVELETIASGFSQPTFVLAAPDGSGRLFITERAGRIRVLQSGSILPDPYLDISSATTTQGERGLLSMAFHPQFSSNRRVFVSYTDLSGDSVISEFQQDAGNPNQLDPSSETIIFQLEQPFANHNGGQIAFAPDGYLYIGFGDGGAGGDPFDNGQNLGTLLGSIIRIDVDGAAPYSVPADNPFVGVAGAQPETFAYGLRNPWRFSFDSLTGRLFVADVGQNSREEINLVEAGGNYGWNTMEGTACYEPATGCNTSGLKLPIHEYFHSEGLAVVGGYVYRGTTIPDLVGGYVFGDYLSGKIWALLEADSGAWIREPLLQTNLIITSFGVDENGEILVVDYLGGLHRLRKQL